jgi:peptidoglycan-associated lipoprotein
MIKSKIVLPVVLAMALGVSACATKKKDLPPAPPMAPITTPAEPDDKGDTGMDTTKVDKTGVPGSAADFVAQSGSDTVLFPFDSYEIDDEAKSILGKQAEWLARYPGIKVTIEGHTDERGTREYNLALGDRRATAAKNFLAAQGVATSRMTTISYGKERPVAEGTDEAAFARNRRAVSVVAVTN